jgi:hypothetical protein
MEELLKDRLKPSWIGFDVSADVAKGDFANA